MIHARPYDDLAALSVFQFLDADDRLEAELVRGRGMAAVALWAEWRAVVPLHALSIVAHVSDAPGSTAFAVLALGNTGQAGVAQAALVARDHRRYRRSLAALARAIRDQMPAFCQERGIHRVEARAWAGHPRASGFLEAVGFHLEAELPGFGADGAATFRQYAWLSTQPTEKEFGPCA